MNNADIVVKKADGTTNVTYTAVASSAGEKSPAIWRNKTVGTAAGHQPTLQLSSRFNGTKTARRMDASGTYPSLVTGSDGKTAIADRVVLNLTGVIPMGMPSADVNEAVAQILNGFASTLFVGSVQSGFAPT